MSGRFLFLGVMLDQLLEHLGTATEFLRRRIGGDQVGQGQGFRSAVFFQGFEMHLVIVV